MKSAAPIGIGILVVIGSLLAIGAASPALAVEQPSTPNANLDAVMGAESTISLEILSNSPTNKVRNKVKNKAVGLSYSFSWPSAGPGGFTSSVAAGTSSGVGAIWEWETSKTIYSFTGSACSSDICLNTLPGGTPKKGSFGVPGRSLSASGVTLSSASLSSSLVTFFSPPSTLVRTTSSVAQLATGEFRYRTRVMNLTATPIVFDLETPPPCSACNATGVTIPPGGVQEYCLVDPHPAREPGDNVTDIFTVCGAAIPDGPHSACVGGSNPGANCVSNGNCLGGGTCATQGVCSGAANGGAICLTDADCPGAACVPVLCSDGQAASRGKVNILVPDPSVNIGTGPFLTPYKVTVNDPDGNGILEPGEMANLAVSLLNAGPANLTAVSATLSSPAIDLTLDGTANAVAVTIVSPPGVQYSSIVGTVPSSPTPGNCSTPEAPLNPATNQSPFQVSIPATHPAGVGRPFVLTVTGTPAGGAPNSFHATIPFVVVIGAVCSPL